MSGERDPDLEDDDGADAPAKERPFDLHDKRSVLERDKALRHRADRLDEAYKALMQHKDGRLLVWDLLEGCSVFGVQFFGEATHQTSFQLGERNVGIKLFARLMRLCPELYATMQKENGQ